MANEEYRSIIYSSTEDRNREFKQSFPWQRSTHTNTMAKVTKTILAMANLRDGGHIVIGVEEDQNNPNLFNPVGVSQAHLETYSFEEIADFVIKSDVDITQVTFATPLPGTRLYDRLLKEKRILLNNYPPDWKRYFFQDIVYAPKNLSVEEIAYSPEIGFDIKLKMLDKLKQFPEVQERYNREKGTIRGISSGKLPFVSIAPVVRLTASYLAYETIYAGLIKAKKMNLAPSVRAFDYFKMKSIEL